MSYRDEDPSSRYRDELLAAADLALETASPDPEILAAELYERWYAPRAPDDCGPALHPHARIAQYRAADASSARFESGWTVVAPDKAAAVAGPPESPWQLAAGRTDLIRWVDPVDLIYHENVGLRPPTGARVWVTARRDSASLSTGWWSTVSGGWPNGKGTLLRLYWSVMPGQACLLISALTSSLVFDEPWAVKCAVHSETLSRPDAFVLYLAAGSWDTLRPCVAAVHRKLGSQLRGNVPGLTLEVGRGLALAEDPPEGSFGTSRCRVLAEGLTGAITANVNNRHALLRAAVDALNAHGVATATPYLNRDSSATYSLNDQ